MQFQAKPKVQVLRDNISVTSLKIDKDEDYFSSPYVVDKQILHESP